MNYGKKMKILAVFLGVGYMTSVACAGPAPVSDISTQRTRVEVNEGYDNSSSRSDDSSRAYGTGQQTSSSSADTMNGGMFQQVQQLQQEVATLRGQLEEQGNAIGNLKQQQQELERRLSGGAVAGSNVTAGNAASRDSTASNNGPMSQPSSAANTSVNSDGREEYEAAYALLKDKNYDGASTAFKNVTNKYPDSDYAGSSWFWLGFVYQTKGDMDSSAKAFSSLIEHFPNHTKVDDAKYNLGKIYNQQGKTDQARTLLKEVAAGNSKSAPLAKSYLESM